MVSTEPQPFKVSVKSKITLNFPPTQKTTFVMKMGYLLGAGEVLQTDAGLWTSGTSSHLFCEWIVTLEFR